MNNGLSIVLKNIFLKNLKTWRCLILTALKALTQVEVTRTYSLFFGTLHNKYRLSLYIWSSLSDPSAALFGTILRSLSLCSRSLPWTFPAGGNWAAIASSNVSLLWVSISSMLKSIAISFFHTVMLFVHVGSLNESSQCAHVNGSGILDRHDGHFFLSSNFL